MIVSLAYSAKARPGNSEALRSHRDPKRNCGFAKSKPWLLQRLKMMPSATCVGMAMRLTAMATYAVELLQRARREMDCLTKMYVRAREFHRNLTKGQTMTEYAMIVAVIAVAVFVTYQVMGQNINQLATWVVDNDLTSGS